MSPASPNITSPTNSTVDFDYYCNDMPIDAMIWALFSAAAACVGVPASVWLLWVLSQKQRSGQSNNGDIYIFNLTVMDVVFNLYLIPAVLNYIEWEIDVLSKIANVLYGFNLAGRPLFMMCICVDCFMAVVHPVVYMKIQGSRYRWLPCAAVWTFTLLFGMLIAFYTQLFISSFTGIPYLLAIPTIIACDLTTLCTLRKPRPSSGRNDVHPQRQRALQTITTSLVMTLVSYLPVLIVCPFLSLMRVTAEIKMCVIMIPILIAPLIGSITMPLLQLHSLGRLSSLQKCTRVSGSSGQAA